MGRYRRPLFLENSLDNHVVTFSDQKQWQLKQKLSEKAWDGDTLSERAKDQNWEPHEAHSVYECVQIRGPEVGITAIVKLRIE